MKLRKLNKVLQGVALGICLSPWTVTYAATQEVLWGKTESYVPLLKNYSLNQPTVSHGLRLPENFSNQTNTTNSFRFLKGFVDETQVSHVRYDQYYQGLPVWGAQLIYHVSAQNTKVTGQMIDGIAKDISNLNGKMSLEQIKQIAIGNNATPAHMKIDKIIYFNKDISNKAILAYHVAYATATRNGPAILSYIIDANDGKILQAWDALPTAGPKPQPLGQGNGGTDLNNGAFQYQFGTLKPGLNSFGNFGVVEDKARGTCSFSNDFYRVLNLKNKTEATLGFQLPVSYFDESRLQLAAFIYNCSAPDYSNKDDNGYAPTNHGSSPVNDVNYFVRQTVNMFVKDYSLQQPIGALLPLRVFTHLASYDNAYACGPHCMEESGIYGPQQLVFGNGETMFAPLTESDVVAHEFGHLVTENFSNLTYAEQSGGMNEAFSDITGMAFNYYLRTTMKFTWYKLGVDWNVGTSIGLPNGKPLRYMSNPPLDGRSIGNAANFVPGMNPHLSSGVFNKMFTILATKANWDIKKAYQVVLDANMKYWTSGITFNDASCGVRDAAAMRGYSRDDVVDAFRQVGVTCLRPSLADM